MIECYPAKTGECSSFKFIKYFRSSDWSKPVKWPNISRLRASSYEPGNRAGSGPILLSVHVENFSPVNRDEIQETQQMAEHKLVSFAAVVALWTLVTSLINLIRILLKREYLQDKTYAILEAMFRKQSYFVQKVSASRLPGLECSYEIIFIPVTEISVTTTEISVTGPARPLIWAHRHFYEGKSGESRSRKPNQPGWPGSYEQALKLGSILH